MPALDNGNLSNGTYSTSSDLPLTQERPVADELDKFIQNPGVARANRAISKENPTGSPDSRNDQNVLQQHVDFWDFDKDGKIYPWDTYKGFYRIGFHPILAFVAIFVIHPTFSWWSQDGWMPDPFFNIKVKNMHRTRHGSDSQVYDSEGRFVPQKFEDIFTKYDKDNKGGLNFWELMDMIQSVRKIMDPVGWTAMFLEWATTYYVCHNKEGWVEKEKIRGVYDGSFFYILEQENNKRKALGTNNQIID